jgi:hypothetical protein
MATSAKKIFSSKAGVFYLYCLFIIAICFYSYKKQAYNWDMLAYMAVVLSYENNDISNVHQTVYDIAKKEIPPLAFSHLTDTSSSYKKLMAESPGEFHLQYPFYSVKPLYTGLVWLFYKAGIPLPKATVLPSLLAFFGIALLLFSWIKRYHTANFTACVSSLLMLSPPLLLASQISTPDSLSALLLLAAFFFIVEKKQPVVTAILLSVSVFARLDNILPSIFISLAIFYKESITLHISLKKYLLFLLVLIICYVLISSVILKGEWGALYYPAFFSHLNEHYDIHRSFSFTGYISLVKSQLMTGLYYSLIIPYLLLCLLFLYNPLSKKLSGYTTEQILCVASIVIIAVRFILQPAVTDRFYLAYYLTTVVFLLKRMQVRNFAVTDSLLHTQKSTICE